jgi:hypothetical protein
MSGPHPDAVGSHGEEAARWLREVAGVRLRWWQDLALTRALEFDAEGRLVWLEVDLSTPRQVGKSWGCRSVATWRIHRAGLFGEEQLVLHTGKDLPVCNEVMRPARAWARQRDGYTVREQNGNEEIGVDGSRWIVRSKFSVYGYAVSLGLVDEAWGVAAEIVEDGVEPTMGDRVDPQLWLVSTAHRKATSLFPLRRAAALERLEEPGSTLLIEWSAPRDTALDDRAAWRSSSPHWSRQRERLLEAKLRRVQQGVSEDPDEDDPVESFRAQYLNIWPVRTLVSSAREEPLVAPEEWEAARDLSVSAPAGPVQVAVEDWFGRGAAACSAGALPDGRIVVWGDVFPDREAALAWAVFTAEGRPGSGIYAGASLPVAEVAEWAPEATVVKAGASELKRALPLVRVLVRQGRLIHSGGEAMTQQTVGCRVQLREGGLVIPQRADRRDLVRAMAWAVQAVVAGGPAVALPRPQVF